MGNENLYSLISLEEFKAILGIDDREDKLSRFCLVTATYTIEQYCKRKLLRKKYFEMVEYDGSLFLPLREYPVREVLAIYTIGSGERVNNKEKRKEKKEEREIEYGELIEPEFYRVIPDCGTDMDLPFSVELSPAVARVRCKAVKVIYWAGYSKEQLTMNKEQRRGNTVPEDLKAACLELASWNFNRYRSKRIGMTGNIRGVGKEGEHFEISMPENVRTLIEPYKRRVI